MTISLEIAEFATGVFLAIGLGYMVALAIIRMFWWRP